MKRFYLIGLFIILLFPLNSCSNQADSEELIKLQERVNSLEQDIELKNNEIERLIGENEILADKIKEQTESKIINSKPSSSISLDNYLLLENYEIDFDNDNNNEKVELYAQVGIYEGEYMWDDGQRWMLIMRDGENSFVLFDDYVQIGVIKVKIYKSFYDYNYHIISILETGAGYVINDYAYDIENDNFIETQIGEVSNISWIYLQ